MLLGLKSAITQTLTRVQRYFFEAEWVVRTRTEAERGKTLLHVTLSRSNNERDEYQAWRLEVAFDKKDWFRFGGQLEFNDDAYSEGGLSYVHLPFVAIYFGDFIPQSFIRAVHQRFERWFEFPEYEKRKRELALYNERIIRFQLHQSKDGFETEYMLWWDFWNANRIGYSSLEWWRTQHINLNDLIFGEVMFTKKRLREDNVDVQMPERTYHWTRIEEEFVYKRTRWPWPKTYTITTMDALEGEHIPIPGKGENSWDCGMDATYGLGFGAGTSFEDAPQKLVESVTKDRQKRGWTAEDAIAFTASVRAKYENPSEPSLNDVEN